MTGKRILVIDDDKAVVQYLALLLRKAGYVIMTAFDPVQALMQARRDPPDLILTDLLMPAGGGYILMERLASFSQTAGIPIIVLTASDAPDMEARARAVGAAHIVRKPCDDAILLAVVQESLAAG